MPNVFVHAMALDNLITFGGQPQQNVVSIGARMHSPDVAVALVDTFLAEPFSGDPRHQRRIDLVTAYETSH